MSGALPDDAEAMLQVAQTVLATTLDAYPTLVGRRVPEGWPPTLIPAPPVVTIGGMYAARGLTAVFRYPSDTEQPLAAFAALLDADGWRCAEQGFSEGFESTRIAMFCRESALVTIYRAPSNSAGSSLMVTIAPCEGWPCEADPESVPWETLRVPRLAVPAGVHSDSGGGSSGGGDHVTHHIRIVSDQSPAELLPFYARQLGEAGWRLRGSQARQTDAVQWLEATDRKGHLWHGLLTVFANSVQRDSDEGTNTEAAVVETLGPRRDVFIYMAKVMP